VSDAAVTAVVPTRDRVELLQRTLRSLVGQRGVAVEVVVVDDGSTTAAADAIRALEHGPVRVLRNKRSRGVAAARNQGAEAAGAPWVAFCDDDDLWTPTKAAGQVAAAEASRRAWSYTGAVKFETGPTIWQVMWPPDPEEVGRRLPLHNVIPAGASNVLVDRRTFLDVGGFDEGLAHLADWDLWLRLLALGLPACAPGIGVAYRLHPGAMSLDPRGILDELRVLDDRWRHLRGGAALDPGPTHLWIAMSWLRAGRRRPAMWSYLRAVRSQPRRGLRGALRTLHPRPPRPAHVLGPAGTGGGALKRVEEVELPDEMRDLLEELAVRAPAAETPR
jgi:glycosyltransferase involved in cell wall biosynthesis